MDDAFDFADFAPAPTPPARTLVIGLVNGMPGEAAQHAARQFGDILAAAARTHAVRIRPIALADVEADLVGRHALRPDGLIVTGMPPRASCLSEEPAFPALAAVADFAIAQAVPTVWSCLGAHAAVLHLDGIARDPLPRKLSGIIECERMRAPHWLLDGLPRRWRVPHSRCNDIPEAALREAGYRIVSRCTDGGVDLFVKDVGALFLFCQGHPEYDADTLLREYRRDIRQFLAGERAEYPDVPTGMFGPDVTAMLEMFRERALHARSAPLMPEFPWPPCAAALTHRWRDVAIRLFANWLTHVAAWRPAGPDLVRTDRAARRRRLDAAVTASAG